MFEAVSGPNAFYQAIEGKDPYEAGAGNSFTPENMAEIKRLENIILEDAEYNKFCQIVEVHAPSVALSFAGLQLAMGFTHLNVLR